MTNEIAIITGNHDFCPDLTKHEQRIVLAKQDARISTIGDTELLQAVNNYVSISIFETKFKFEDSELIPIITTIATDIRNDFGHLTLKEVELAFRNGVRGLYGEFQGLSVRTYYMWISQFSKDRNKALKKQADHEREKNYKAQSEKTQEEKDLIMATYILKEFESFIKTDQINKYIAWDQYLWLRKKNIIIKPEGKERDKIIVQAKERLKNEFSPMVATNKLERIEFASIIERVMVKGESDNMYLLRHCACIVMEKFYAGLKRKNKNLKELLIIHVNLK